MTTDGHSDPDLLDLDDVPDTATLIAAAADPSTHNLAKGLRALGRWAKKQHEYHKDLRALAVWVVGSVLVGAFTEGLSSWRHPKRAWMLFLFGERARCAESLPQAKAS